MIQIGSKTAEKNSAQTNNKQTNRQTDTTKIMVTWTWTKNAQILYIIVGFVLQRIHCKPYPKDLQNWCHCQLCTDWCNVYVFLDMMLLSMKNKILLKFYVNITVQKLIIKEILLYTMNSFISTSAVTGRAAFWAHQPISITTSPAPPHKFNQQWKSHTYLYSPGAGHLCTLVCTTFHPQMERGWVGLAGWLYTWDGIPMNVVIHLCTKRARRRLTLMTSYGGYRQVFFSKSFEKITVFLKFLFSKNLVRKIPVMGITTVESNCS